MLHRVALVRKDVSEEPSSSIIRVTRIGELRTLAVTSNRHTHRYIPKDGILQIINNLKVTFLNIWNRILTDPLIMPVQTASVLTVDPINCWYKLTGVKNSRFRGDAKSTQFRNVRRFILTPLAWLCVVLAVSSRVPRLHNNTHTTGVHIWKGDKAHSSSWDETGLALRVYTQRPMSCGITLFLLHINLKHNTNYSYRQNRLVITTRHNICILLTHIKCNKRKFHVCYVIYVAWPPLWSSDQSSWLLIQRYRVQFSALPDFLRSSGCSTGSTQPLWG
jgi:hypothetical protein